LSLPPHSQQWSAYPPSAELQRLEGKKIRIHFATHISWERKKSKNLTLRGPCK